MSYTYIKARRGSRKIHVLMPYVWNKISMCRACENFDKVLKPKNEDDMCPTCKKLIDFRKKVNRCKYNPYDGERLK